MFLFNMCRLNSNKFQKYTTVNYNDVVSKLTELPVSDNDLVLESFKHEDVLGGGKNTASVILTDLIGFDYSHLLKTK